MKDLHVQMPNLKTLDLLRMPLSAVFIHLALDQDTSHGHERFPPFFLERLHLRSEHLSLTSIHYFPFSLPVLWKPTRLASNRWSLSYVLQGDCVVSACILFPPVIPSEPNIHQIMHRLDETGEKDEGVLRCNAGQTVHRLTNCVIYKRGQGTASNFKVLLHATPYYGTSSSTYLHELRSRRDVIISSCQ